MNEIQLKLHIERKCKKCSYFYPKADNVSSSYEWCSIPTNYEWCSIPTNTQRFKRGSIKKIRDSVELKRCTKL